MHRLVSAVFILGCCALLAAAAPRAGLSRSDSAAAALLLCGALLFYSTPVASTNALGEFLFLASVLIPWLTLFGRGGLPASIACGLLAFYTKQYFVMGIGLVAAYLFLAVSRRKALVYGACAAATLVASLIAVHLTSPYFLDNTVFAVRNLIGALHSTDALLQQPAFLRRDLSRVGIALLVEPVQLPKPQADQHQHEDVRQDPPGRQQEPVHVPKATAGAPPCGDRTASRVRWTRSQRGAHGGGIGRGRLHQPPRCARLGPWPRVGAGGAVAHHLEPVEVAPLGSELGHRLGEVLGTTEVDEEHPVPPGGPAQRAPMGPPPRDPDGDAGTLRRPRQETHALGPVVDSGVVHGLPAPELVEQVQALVEHRRPHPVVELLTEGRQLATALWSRPRPTPSTRRPCERWSRVTVWRARTWGRRRATGVTMGPSRRRSVVMAAAASTTQGSATASTGDR